MPIDKTDAEQFFQNYGKALGNRNAEKIAPYWGIPALVLSDQGTIPVAKSEEVVGFFASSMEQYAGIDRAEAVIKSAVTLSQTIIACEIEWKHLDASGEQVGDEAGHYILRQDEDGIRIHVYTPRL